VDWLSVGLDTSKKLAARVKEIASVVTWQASLSRNDMIKRGDCFEWNALRSFFATALEKER
jgi:hypothetical protein